ncbi:PAS domain S-box protein [Limibacillus sp. MBR-115]|jgi:PAS domain S-box-containing protein|uniref:PAS domain S-box protein n=1 Tax=Limibacillus sp. MBR-115 TaxID=3156465 RepID=UPI00339712F8
MLLLLALVTINAERVQRQNFEAELDRLTELSAEHLDTTFDTARVLMASLSANQSITSLDAMGCRQALSDLEAQPDFADYFTRLAILDWNGLILCSSKMSENGQNVQIDRDIARALEEERFVIGDYQIGPISGEPVLPALYPLTMQHDVVHNLIGVGIRLSAFDVVLRTLNLPPRSGVFLVDDKGTVVTALHPAGRNYWQGRSVAGTPFFESLQGRQEGVVEGPGADEQHRVYKFTRLEAPADHLTLVLTLHRQQMLEEFVFRFLQTSGPALAVVAIILLLIFHANQRLVVAHVQALVDYCGRLVKEGTRGGRPDVSDSAPAEVIRISETLGRMVMHLAERNRQLGDTQQIARIVPLVWDRRFDSVKVTQEFWERLGEARTDDRISVRTLFERIRADHRFKAYADFASALRNGFSVDRVVPMRTAEGYCQFRFRVEPVEDPSTGRVVSLRGFLQDIDEIERLRELAAQHEQDYRLIFNSVSDGLIVLDHEGRITEANPVAAEMHGLSPGDLAGKDSRSLVHREAEAEYNRFLQTVGEGEIFNAETKGKRKDGSSFVMQVIGAPVSLAGKPHYLVTLRDVSERKQTETQLMRAQRMEAVGQLTGGVAHDFNNLLQALFGALDALEDDTLPEEEHKKALEQAFGTVERGAQLTQHLLAFSRQQPLDPQPTELVSFVDSMVPLLKRTLGEQVAVHFSPDVEKAQVLVDPSQLDSSLMNLAVNARDAMPEGGILRFGIHVATIDEQKLAGESLVEIDGPLQPGEYVILEVSDTGVGMDSETRHRAFEPFFTTKEQGKGTGLGLSMVFGFMKQSGGHITIYSEKDIGTTFRLYFPVIELAACEPLLVHESGDIEGGHGERILLVEDNENVRRSLIQQLTGLGYSVTDAASAHEALEKLEASGTEPSFDLLFSDVVIPGGKSGYQLVNEVRERWPNIHCLLTSGFPLVDHQERLPEDVALLSKPYRRRELARAIRSALDGVRRRGAEVTK